VSDGSQVVDGVKTNLVQWKIMNRTIMPTIPAAKNFAVFSLFFWRSTFAKATLALAALAAVSVAFAIVKDRMS
jgi:hypothetical protein